MQRCWVLWLFRIKHVRAPCSFVDVPCQPHPFQQSYRHIASSETKGPREEGPQKSSRNFVKVPLFQGIFYARQPLIFFCIFWGLLLQIWGAGGCRNCFSPVGINISVNPKSCSSNGFQQFTASFDFWIGPLCNSGQSPP